MLTGSANLLLLPGLGDSLAGRIVAGGFPEAVARLLEMLALGTAELLNVSSLGNDLDLRRETVEHYLAVCERLYLVRRL